MFKIKDRDDWDMIIRKYPFVEMLKSQIDDFSKDVFVKFHKDSLLVAGMGFTESGWRNRKGCKPRLMEFPKRIMLVMRCDPSKDSYFLLKEKDLEGFTGAYLDNILYFLDKFRVEGPLGVMVFEKSIDAWIVHIVKRFAVADLVAISSEEIRHYVFDPVAPIDEEGLRRSVEHSENEDKDVDSNER